MMMQAGCDQVVADFHVAAARKASVESWRTKVGDHQLKPPLNKGGPLVRASYKTELINQVVFSRVKVDGKIFVT
jgi:hypothetical protein